MKIITSHERTDMDALAAIYAASLLFPDYVGLLPHHLNRNLREFLALYQDQLHLVTRKEIARRRISELLLVDTQGIAPLRGMDSRTKIRIIDHHDRQPDLAPDVVFEGEAVGATTTLLVERLRQREDIELNTVGATLLLMGIYEDTGSLSYTTTTARDAEAAAWLLAHGADLKLAGDFLYHPLSQEQREALAKLIAQSSVHTVQGRSVCISAVALDRYVEELSSLIHQIMDVYEPDACFLLAEYEGDVQIIARSTTDAIDVAALLRDFGGGGHDKAAAALVEGASLSEIVDRLLAAMETRIEPPTRVREIMSTNVHTLDLDMSVRDAARLMRRYGHEGFPVVDGERLIGILTRSNVDRALHHRLGEMPVRNILHTGPLHVHPDDPVDAVQRVMIEHGLGQVPVVEEGRFIGIVTRTDLIKLWTPREGSSRAAEIRRLMEEALPDALEELLIKARDAANDLGYSLYVVGGFVRDLLLGTPTLDLDLVVEGDAIAMAHRLAEKIRDGLCARVRSHARFGTAKVILEGVRPPGVPPSLDFVTARTEFYERPSVLPQVERSSIKQDLYRRDFTINTLAICLDRDRYGELLDFYGGERDIREGRIRVLHNLSMVEDPTRILRAVRFEQRLGFTIEERTAELIDDALDLLDDVSGERLRNELYLILKEREPERVLMRLAQMNVLSHIHPELRFGRETGELFRRLRERFHEWPAPDDVEAHHIDQEEDEEESRNGLPVCYLALLTSYMTTATLQSFVERLRIPNRDARLLHEVARLREALADLQAPMMLPSSIYRLLHPFSRAARFVLSVLTDSAQVRARLELYERELADVHPCIDGHTLRAMGAPPGPVYGVILERVRDARLDGLVKTKEEEEALAGKLVEAARGKGWTAEAE
ncbi:MAG: CBS domain-containing protein [Chloroflexi bacterium]|nr:CBS domain-containing protein [Chloroflexota bacterium]